MYKIKLILGTKNEQIKSKMVFFNCIHILRALILDDSFGSGSDMSDPDPQQCLRVKYNKNDDLVIMI